MHDHQRALEVGEPHGEGAVATADGDAAVVLRAFPPIEVRAEGDHLDGLPVADEVHARLPTGPLDDVGCRAVVVECVSRNDVLSVG